MSRAPRHECIVLDTLGKLVEHGHTVTAYCPRRHHDARLDLAAFPADTPIVGLADRLVCTACNNRKGIRTIVAPPAPPDPDFRLLTDTLARRHRTA